MTESAAKVRLDGTDRNIEFTTPDGATVAFHRPARVTTIAPGTEVSPLT